MLAGAVCTSSFGQRRVKYKDIYEQIGKEPAEHSILKLNEFQKMQPEFPNTYVQTAIIDMAWLMDEDPFLHYEYVTQLIYNTKLYLGLSINKIEKDDKEVKKNKAYYTNLGLGNADNIDQQDVLNHLKKLKAKVEEYETNVNKIIGNFNRTIAKYNGCIDTYKGIVARQSNYKNLLLTNSADLRKEMSDLSQNYDSVNYFFSEFKAALGSYPIKNYNQQTKVIPIMTYRLEGLTSSDFIQPEIPIWDYQSWVKEAFETMDGNIAKLKNDSEKYISNLRSRVESLKKQKATTDSIQEIVAPNALVNLVEKYDFESMLTSALKYESELANMQIASMRSANNVDDPSSFNEDYSQKANYFYDLYMMSQNCHGLLNTLKSRITDNNITKHEQIVNSLYKNKDFFKGNYIKEQNNDIDKILQQNLQNFELYTIDNLCPESVTVNHAGNEISALPTSSSLDQAADGKYITVYTTKDNSGNRYICGYRKTGASASSGFIAKVASNGSLAWCKDINAGSGANRVVEVIPSKYAGLVAVATNGSQSAIIKLDSDGKQLSSTKLTSTLCPTVAYWDEITDKVSTVLKGAKGNESADNSDAAMVETVTLGGNASETSKSFNIKGKIVDIIATSKGMFVICNFSEIQAGSQTLSASNNVAMVTINGDNVSATATDCTSDVMGMKAFQVNAGTINVTGAYKAMGNTISKSDKPAYLLFGTDGKFIYKN